MAELRSNLRVLSGVLPFMGLLAFPALAAAVTQVSVVAVPGVGNVVAVHDDDSSSVIDIENGITTPEPPPGNVRYVAVRNPAGVQAGAGCGVDDPTMPTIVACEGVFPLVHVVAEGGNDKITMDLIVNDQPMNAEVYGDAGDDELKATPDTRDVPQPTTYIECGGGNDVIVSGNGADELHGGGRQRHHAVLRGPGHRAG
jgi:hypothetical protein